MSDEEGSMPEENSESLLTTEFRDGQLQIVEVAPFQQGQQSAETHILPDMENPEAEETRYVQVLNADKSVLQLDLLNMTLVRCEDGSDTTYKLLANAESSEGDDDTVTCVLRAEGQDDQENQDQGYVMMDQDAPLMFLKSEVSGSNENEEKIEDKTKKLSAMEILEKAKALKKTAEVLSQTRRSNAGRKRKSNFPPPHELLASPNFKLFLYSCKMCHFKCNAVKEMTAHKAAEHSSTGRLRSGRPGAPLQCARCPYKATSHSQLMRHMSDSHINVMSLTSLDSKQVTEAHVLVCGACGFECDTKVEFKAHVREKHGSVSVSI